MLKPVQTQGEPMSLATRSHCESENHNINTIISHNNHYHHREFSLLRKAADLPARSAVPLTAVTFIPNLGQEEENIRKVHFMLTPDIDLFLIYTSVEA